LDHHACVAGARDLDGVGAEPFKGYGQRFGEAQITMDDVNAAIDKGLLDTLRAKRSGLCCSVRWPTPSIKMVNLKWHTHFDERPTKAILGQPHGEIWSGVRVFSGTALRPPRWGNFSSRQPDLARSRGG
jgi:hypothetical protein